MKRSWNPREDTPSPTISKMSQKAENGRSRLDSSSRSRISSYRRSRSPRRKKSVSPVSKRASVLHEKRHISRSSRGERIRTAPKRSRLSSRSRSSSRRMSKEKVPATYACTSTKDTLLERTGSRGALRDERYRSGDRYLVDRPTFRGPIKDMMLDRDSLKKIVVNMRGTPSKSDSIKRDIVNPEDITVVRRAVTSRRGQYQAETGNWIKSSRSVYEIEDRHCNTEELGLYKSEGSRPIFDRDEIKHGSRKFDEDEQGTRRLFSVSPPHSGRRHGSSERIRSRESYYEEDRSARHREPSGSRPKDYGSHSYERHREERVRYSRRSRSRERTRDFGHERRERYDERDYRRSGIRGRSSARPFRRHPSPVDLRRINGRRMRSSEGEMEPHHREKEHPTEGEYSAPDYPMESHGYYEGEGAEGQMPPSSRGGAHSMPFRGRGSGIPMIRGGEMLMRGGPPVRPMRGLFMPRVPGMGRRLPFPPPRLIRPIVRPVIRVLAPVIPVRSPSVIPVRHPVIPLPFQCEAFR